MKKVLIALFFFCASAQAIEVGGYLGFRTNKIDTQDSGQTYHPRNAYHVGGYFLLPVFPLISLRSGAAYVVRDVNAEGQLTVRFPYIFRATYLDIPINLQISILDFYAYGGLIYSSNLSYSREIDTAQYSVIDTGSTIEKSNVLLNMAVGYRVYNLALASIGLELFYEHGLTNINTTGAKEYFRSYGINLAVGFGT